MCVTTVSMITRTVSVITSTVSMIASTVSMITITDVFSQVSLEMVHTLEDQNVM